MQRLPLNKAVEIVLAGLKGNVSVEALSRKYGISKNTYYVLRRRFLSGGIEGLQNQGKTSQIKALENRIKKLERALTRKNIEAQILKTLSDSLKG
ncbi:MAG: helix-turn-helix domain-containing protein [Peptococcaceae bacterium]|nr:helix-turn-helix domain-containing protein [Peptococcaceae bacterium]